MTKNYLDFLFHDEESGENFFVELDMNGYENKETAVLAAIAVANDYFDDPEFIEIVSAEYAELMGLDTY